MTMHAYRLVADFPWPDWHTMEKPDVVIGQVVYEHRGPTYGCISPDEIAVTLAPDEGPFYGIPKDSLEKWAAGHVATERPGAQHGRCTYAALLRLIDNADIDNADIEDFWS